MQPLDVADDGYTTYALYISGIDLRVISRSRSGAVKDRMLSHRACEQPNDRRHRLADAQVLLADDNRAGSLLYVARRS